MGEPVDRGNIDQKRSRTQETQNSGEDFKEEKIGEMMVTEIYRVKNKQGKECIE
jgi:hypothetical protein